MQARRKRILIAAAIGSFVAIVANRLDAEFTRLGVSHQSTILADLIVGFVSGFCAFVWASLSAERASLEIAAANSRRDEVIGERTRIAYEIHDVLAQCFAGIIFHMEASSGFPHNSAEGRAFSERALRIAREGLAESRSLVRGLRDQASGEDFRGAVVHLMEVLTEGTHLEVSSTVDDGPCPLSPSRETQLLRIIREAVTNVVRHANADRVSVSLCTKSDQIQLCIEDDGCGFMPERLHSDTFGLASMHQRAFDLGGLLWIYTQPGCGAQVVAIIPVASPIREGRNRAGRETHSGRHSG